MRNGIMAVALLGLAAVPAAAQNKGAIEIGGFIKLTDYDNSFRVSRTGLNSWGGGGRLGYFLSPHWEIEADGSLNPTDADFFATFTSTSLKYYPFHLRALYNARFGEGSPLAWFVGAGPAYNRYGPDLATEPDFHGSDWGGSLMGGFRFHLTSGIALRVDGTIDYIPSPNNGKDEVVGQAAGINAASPPSKNLNLGAQGGLSIMLGMCNHRADGTTLSPSSASISPGGAASFTGASMYCGRPDVVVYSVSGPGLVDMSGRYTGTDPGTATITACGRKNRICANAVVTVVAPPPPPPAVVERTLARCELLPAQASPRIDRPVTYQVIAHYSDGTSAPLAEAPLLSTGATVSGREVSWSGPGAKTITADCGNGISATAAADVQQLVIVVNEAYFNVNKTDVFRGEDRTRLGEVAVILKEHPDIRLVIDGHTDSDGSVASNARLGMGRANAIRDYFAAHGVPVDQMTIVLRSFGECQPVAPNRSVQGRAQNRRAEIREFGNTAPGEADANCAEGGRERKP